MTEFVQNNHFQKQTLPSIQTEEDSATVQPVFSHTAGFLVAAVGEEEHTKQTIRGTADKWL